MIKSQQTGPMNLSITKTEFRTLIKENINFSKHALKKKEQCSQNITWAANWTPLNNEQSQLYSSKTSFVEQLSSIFRNLQLHQCFDVINPRCFPITGCGAKSLLQQLLLLPLDRHHPLLHRIFHNELQHITENIDTRKIFHSAIFLVYLSQV